MPTKITAYTDGATERVNPGNGGYGVVLLVRIGDYIHIKNVAAYFPLMFEVTDQKDVDLLLDGIKRKPALKNGKWFVETTNNRMELGAIIEAMSRVKKPDDCDLTIYSDSQWAINITTGEWNAKENKDLVNKAQELVRKFHSVKFNWVRGHQGDRWNEHCDRLASWIITKKSSEPYTHITKEKVK